MDTKASREETVRDYISRSRQVMAEWHEDFVEDYANDAMSDDEAAERRKVVDEVGDLITLADRLLDETGQ